MPELTYDDIQALPIIQRGHFADLIIDDGQTRVWKSRCTLHDGELEHYHVEFMVDGKWVDIKSHPKHEKRLSDGRYCQFVDVPVYIRLSGWQHRQWYTLRYCLTNASAALDGRERALLERNRR